MMPTKKQIELNEILQDFDVLSDEFILDRTIYAGPDEMLYLMHDESNDRIGVWARDHMEEDLKYEANWLKKEQKIIVNEWIRLKNRDDYRVDLDGITYAVFSY